MIASGQNVKRLLTLGIREPKGTAQVTLLCARWLLATTGSVEFRSIARAPSCASCVITPRSNCLRSLGAHVGR
jgi:hypothetical protein